MGPFRRRFALAIVGMGVLLSVGCATAKQDYGGVAVKAGPTGKVLDIGDVAKHSAEAVVLIETDIGRGMGFVIDPRGYLLTNRHVVEDADHIEHVEFPALEPSLRLASVLVEYIDPQQDLALLKVTADRELPYLRFATGDVESVTRYLGDADPVFLLRRNAGNGELAARLGQVTTLDEQNPLAGPGPFVGLTLDVREGQSGGPVIDRYGRAVGVVTWTWRDRRGGYAIPITDATRMLAERPQLRDRKRQTARAKLRARAFLSALDSHEVQVARRMTSPSRAKKIRTETVEEIAHNAIGPDSPAMQAFLAAIEDLARTGELDDEDVMHRLQELVLRTGSSEFRKELGVEGLSSGQVLAFFTELGQAYLKARRLGDQSPGDALEAAIKRLYTVDAARTFALAELYRGIRGRRVSIERVEVVPGQYSPRAIVTLRADAVADDEGMQRATVQSDLRGGELLSLHLRMEWGDWYVADVAPGGRA